MEFNQSDLLHGCIKAVARGDGTSDLPERLVDRIGAPMHASVVAWLASLLLEQGASGTVECNEITPPDINKLDARLFTVTGSDGKKRTYFFRIKDAASASALPIVGVLFTLLSAKYPAAAVQTATVAKTLWSNIISLHHEHDHSAIETLRVIAAIRASRFAAFPHDRIVGMEFPSTAEIASSIPDLTFESTLVGLKRLESLHLIECKHWGDQTGDATHRDNRWGERL